MKKYSDVWRGLSSRELTNKAGLKYTESKEGDFDFCLYTDAGKNETIAILGDSHAGAAYHGIANLGTQLANVGEGKGYNTVCLAYHGHNLWAKGGLSYKNYLERFIKVIDKHPEIKKVLLITRGMAVIGGIGDEKFRCIYENTINELLKKGKEVVIIAENPVLKYSIRSAIKRGINGLSINYEHLKLLKNDVQESEIPYIDALKSIEKKFPVDILYPNDIFCPGAECTVEDENGNPLYLDEDHLSVYGSSFQAQKLFRPWLEKKHKKDNGLE